MHDIGLAIASVYILDEKEFAPGLHSHYIYSFKDSKFGVGIGYECVFEEPGLNTLGLVGKYTPLKNWDIIVSPDLSFESEHRDELSFATHL